MVIIGILVVVFVVTLLFTIALNLAMKLERLQQLAREINAAGISQPNKAPTFWKGTGISQAYGEALWQRFRQEFDLTALSGLPRR